MRKKIYKNVSVQAKATLWYTICNILQKGISFLVIPIYTRLLTVDEYGVYSVFQSWRDILIIFATLNLYCGIFTKAMVDYSGDRDSFTSSMQGLSTIVTIILFGIYIFKYVFWNNIFSLDTITMLLMFAYFVFYPSFSFWSVRQRVEYKYIKMVIVTLIVSIIIPIVSLLLLNFTGLREKAVIWGYLISQIIVGMIFYIINFCRCKTFYNKEYWIHALKFNIPLIPHYLSLIILGQADRIMINDLCGSAKAGIYSLAYQVSIVMNVIINALNSAMVPWTYEKLKKKEYKDIKEKFNFLCLIVLVLNICTILVAPEIIKILGTSDYMEAIWIIPSVSVSVYFTYCYGLFSNIEFYYGATKYVMIASSVGAVLNIILNAIFIPIYGFIAAGYTTLVCYLLFMIMHYIFMKKVCKKNINGITVYDNKFIFISSIILCIIAALCMAIYKYLKIRYIAILLLIIFAYINRNKIFQLLKSMIKKGV